MGVHGPAIDILSQKEISTVMSTYYRTCRGNTLKLGLVYVYIGRYGSTRGIIGNGFPRDRYILYIRENL